MGATDVLHYLTDPDTGDAVTAGNTASSRIFKLGRTKPQIGVGDMPLMLELRTIVAAGGSGNISLILRKSATQSGSALSGTITQIMGVPATAQSDARFATAGKPILRIPLPYEADQEYLDIYAVLSGSATLTYEAVIRECPSDKNTQVKASPVGNP